MAKTFILIGVIFVLIGFALPVLQKTGVGRLPGDIYIRKGNMTFYFPIITCLLISLILSLLFSIFGKR